MARSRVPLDDPPEEDRSNYFTQQESKLDFIPSGAAVLDCTLGGGWPLSRFSNLIGDESTGKTLLAIEACANFHKKYPKGLIFYRESEQAFDEEYAAALGMPIDAVEFIDSEDFVTVEDMFADVAKCIKLIEASGQPGLYIVDSLDALSDDVEMKGVESGKGFSEGTYGTAKAKQLSKFFRTLNGRISRANIHLLFVSQTRDKINSQFPAKTRAGGRALDFYACQCLWLSHDDDVVRQRTHNGVKITRIIGIKVRAKCKKNKIALPYRQCDFTIRFGHGVDSLSSSIDWLEKVGYLEEAVGTKRASYTPKLDKMTDAEYWDETLRVADEVKRIWSEVEVGFMQNTRPKYSEEYLESDA